MSLSSKRPLGSRQQAKVEQAIELALAIRHKFFKSNSQSSDDLDSIAKQSLIDAIRKYNPKLGSLKTYVYWWVKKNSSIFFKKQKDEGFVHFDDSKIEFKEPTDTIKLDESSFFKSIIKELSDSLPTTEYRVFSMFYGVNGFVFTPRQRICSMFNLSQSTFYEIIAKARKAIKSRMLAKAEGQGLDIDDYL